MSRILALDFGDKRIGAAISDESQSIALPLCCIDASNINESISRIKEICQRKNIKTILQKNRIRCSPISPPTLIASAGKLEYDF